MNDTTILRNTLRTASALMSVFCLVMIPARGMADGGFFYPHGNTMYEDAQHAFLEYDGETGRERLSILPSFHGDAKDFAWVIPVPGLPELEMEDPDLFQGLGRMTEPVYQSRDGDWDCFNRGTFSPDEAGDLPVEVIDRELVGYYETVTLAATEVDALVAVLDGWGFLHEDNVDQATGILEHYVEQSWYFVTMRVDSTAFDQPGKTAPYYYWYRHLEPIRLTFPADRMVYPMRISALSAAEDSRVYLYVKGDHRMTFEGAETYYAKRLARDDFSELWGDYRGAVAANLDLGDYLTKLHREFGPDQMDRDLNLRRAPTDQEFRLVTVGGFPWTALLIISVPAGIAIRRRFWLRG